MISINNARVIIIGAGPGGLFTAYEIVEKTGRGDNVLIIDKGKSPADRKCSALYNGCKNCPTCELISGGGGSGLFSDGKLTFDLHSGGYLKKYIVDSDEERERLEREIWYITNRFTSQYVYKKSFLGEEVISCFAKENLRIKSYPVVHLGSNNLIAFTKIFINYLQQNGVKFHYDTKVENIAYDTSYRRWNIKVSRGNTSQKFNSDYLAVAVGKEGNFWFSSLIENLGAKVEENNTYIGVRMEISDTIAKNLYKLSLDPKFYMCIGDLKIKTHCFCRHGQVMLLKYFGLPLVGGHTPYIEIDELYTSDKNPNSNFAILYRDKRICTREKAIEIMKTVNEFTGGKLLVQRLEDYLKDVPTTVEKLNNNSIKPSNHNIVPGKIPDNILPGFRKTFIPFLNRVSHCCPGIMHHDNLLYFPAIEWWMRKIEVNKNMEVINLPNLYAVGDGSGWTQGIVQSAATGVIAAKNILEKMLTHKATPPHIVQESEENTEKKEE